MRFPKWAWYIIAIAIVLIVLVILKINVNISSGGFSITQDLVKLSEIGGGSYGRR